MSGDYQTYYLADRQQRTDFVAILMAPSKEIAEQFFRRFLKMLFIMAMSEQEMSHAEILHEWLKEDNLAVTEEDFRLIFDRRIYPDVSLN